MTKPQPNLELLYDRVLTFDEAKPDEYIDSLSFYLSEDTSQIQTIFDNLASVFANTQSILNALKLVFLLIVRIGAPSFFGLEGSKILEVTPDPVNQFEEARELKKITKYCVEKFKKMQTLHEIPNIKQKFGDLSIILQEDPNLPDMALTEFEKQYSEVSVKFQQIEKSLDAVISESRDRGDSFEDVRARQILEQVDGIVIQPDQRFTKAENELILNFFHQKYALLNRVYEVFPEEVDDSNRMKENKNKKNEEEEEEGYRRGIIEVEEEEDRRRGRGGHEEDEEEVEKRGRGRRESENRRSEEEDEESRRRRKEDEEEEGEGERRRRQEEEDEEERRRGGQKEGGEGERRRNEEEDEEEVRRRRKEKEDEEEEAEEAERRGRGGQEDDEEQRRRRGGQENLKEEEDEEEIRGRGRQEEDEDERKETNQSIRIENNKQLQESSTRSLQNFTYFEDGSSLAAFPESMIVEYKDYIYPFKTDVQRKKLKSTLCAFLNTQGGRILIGVGNEGFKVKGLFLTPNDQDNCIRDIDSLLKDFHPKVDPEEVITTFVPIKKKDSTFKPGFYIVKINVRKGKPNELYFTDKTCFKRRNGQNEVQMPVDFKKEILDRSHITMTSHPELFQYRGEYNDPQPELGIPVTNVKDQKGKDSKTQKLAATKQKVQQISQQTQQVVQQVAAINKLLIKNLPDMTDLTEGLKGVLDAVQPLQKTLLFAKNQDVVLTFIRPEETKMFLETVEKNPIVLGNNILQFVPKPNEKEKEKEKDKEKEKERTESQEKQQEKQPQQKKIDKGIKMEVEEEKKEAEKPTRADSSAIIWVRGIPDNTSDLKEKLTSLLEDYCTFLKDLKIHMKKKRATFEFESAALANEALAFLSLQERFVDEHKLTFEKASPPPSPNSFSNKQFESVKNPEPAKPKESTVGAVGINKLLVKNLPNQQYAENELKFILDTIQPYQKTLQTTKDHEVVLTFVRPEEVKCFLESVEKNPISIGNNVIQFLMKNEKEKVDVVQEERPQEKQIEKQPEKQQQQLQMQIQMQQQEKPSQMKKSGGKTIFKVEVDEEKKEAEKSKADSSNIIWVRGISDTIPDLKEKLISLLEDYSILLKDLKIHNKKKRATFEFETAAQANQVLAFLSYHERFVDENKVSFEKASPPSSPNSLSQKQPFEPIKTMNTSQPKESVKQEPVKQTPLKVAQKEFAKPVEVKTSNVLKVSNIPLDETSQEIGYLVRACNAHIRKTVEHQIFQDYVMLYFKTNQDATKAFDWIMQNNFTFKGKKLRVEYTEPQQSTKNFQDFTEEEKFDLENLSNSKLNFFNTFSQPNHQTSQGSGSGSLPIFESQHIEYSVLDTLQAQKHPMFNNSFYIPEVDSQNSISSNPPFNPSQQQQQQHSKTPSQPNELDRLLKLTDELDSEPFKSQPNPPLQSTFQGPNPNFQQPQNGYNNDFSSQQNQDISYSHQEPRENTVFGLPPGKGMGNQEQFRKPQPPGPQNFQQNPTFNPSQNQDSHKDMRSTFGQPPVRSADLQNQQMTKQMHGPQQSQNFPNPLQGGGGQQQFQGPPQKGGQQQQFFQSPQFPGQGDPRSGNQQGNFQGQPGGNQGMQNQSMNQQNQGNQQNQQYPPQFNQQNQGQYGNQQSQGQYGGNQQQQQYPQDKAQQQQQPYGNPQQSYRNYPQSSTPSQSSSPRYQGPGQGFGSSQQQGGNQNQGKKDQNFNQQYQNTPYPNQQYGQQNQYGNQQQQQGQQNQYGNQQQNQGHGQYGGNSQQNQGQYGNQQHQGQQGQYGHQNQQQGQGQGQGQIGNQQSKTPNPPQQNSYQNQQYPSQPFGYGGNQPYPPQQQAQNQNLNPNPQQPSFQNSNVNQKQGAQQYPPQPQNNQGYGQQNFHQGGNYKPQNQGQGQGSQGQGPNQGQGPSQSQQPYPGNYGNQNYGNPSNYQGYPNQPMNQNSGQQQGFNNAGYGRNPGSQGASRSGSGDFSKGNQQIPQNYVNQNQSQAQGPYGGHQYPYGMSGQRPTV